MCTAIDGDYYTLVDENSKDKKEPAYIDDLLSDSYMWVIGGFVVDNQTALDIFKRRTK